MRASWATLWSTVNDELCSTRDVVGDLLAILDSPFPAIRRKSSTSTNNNGCLRDVSQNRIDVLVYKDIDNINSDARCMAYGFRLRTALRASIYCLCARYWL